MPTVDHTIARTAFFWRSAPTCGPTFSAESSTKGPVKALACSHALVGAETPSTAPASAGEWKRPSSERRAMIRSAACA